MKVEPTIMLRSGATLDLRDPSSSSFTIDDIAHGLSLICRYSGQCTTFYSVAEHSLLVSYEAVGHEYAALLHDAAEAFVGDLTRPLKQILPEYKRIETVVERAICERFGISFPLPIEIKNADLRVLAAEQQQIMPPGTSSWANDARIEPANIKVQGLLPGPAKHAFLNRFYELQPSLARRRRA